ncbi:hypothetical protein O181_040983, partial [Austropuccinia psidii MF-1]|nr:hypothetical protein [Austropuccinia psidii MF-1]
MAYEATVPLWPIGHSHHQWPIWPHHHLMDHLWPFVFGAFMALHLNPEAIAAIYAQMAIQWWQDQMVISTFQHIIMSSRHPIIQRTHQRSRASVSASKTNHTIKKSLDKSIHSIPPRQYCSTIIKGFKRQFIHSFIHSIVKCQHSTQSILETIFISIL